MSDNLPDPLTWKERKAIYQKLEAIYKKVDGSEESRAAQEEPGERSSKIKKKTMKRLDARFS